MRTLLILCALLPLAGCDKSPQPPAKETASATEGGPVKGVDRSHAGRPAPTSKFATPDGKPISIAEFRGVPVLVNFWASWCAPCVNELPTLDKLAARHRVDGQLAVAAISQDSGPQTSVDAFLKKLRISDLAAFHDPKMGLSGALGAEVLPTSVLFDAQGKEVWRYVGDLDWSSPAAAKLLAEAGAGPKPS